MKDRGRTNVWILLAAMNGLISVAAGAFGAHALKERLAPADLAVFETGARYQMYHALALLGVAITASGSRPRAARAAGVCLVMGIVFFTGSLYAIALAGWRWLGPITPIGGGLMMLGWLLLGVTAFSRPSSTTAP